MYRVSFFVYYLLVVARLVVISSAITHLQRLIAEMTLLCAENDIKLPLT